MNGGGNFTQKSQEAILMAQNTAREKGQQQIDALHLLLALVSQEGSIVLTLLLKMGVDMESLKKKTISSLTTTGFKYIILSVLKKAYLFCIPLSFFKFIKITAA